MQTARSALDYRANVAMPIRGKETLLHIAARQGNVDMAKLLMQPGALPTLTAANDKHETALDVAIANGHTNMATYLRTLSATNRVNQSP